MYDLWCTRVREETGATGVILIVFGGSIGTGFSMQAPPDLTLATPAILRQVADQIEADHAEGQL
jgi:hypothetical protein